MTMRRSIRFIFGLVVFLMPFSASHRVTAECTPEWLPGDAFPGADGSVLAMMRWNPPDSHKPVLIVGGGFTAVANHAVARNVAIWDGSSWSALGEGLNGPVHALAIFDDGTGPALYAAGYFYAERPAGAAYSVIAKWNGSSWSTFGAASKGDAAYALAVYDGGDGDGPSLYVGGTFQRLDGVEVNSIAKWNPRRPTRPWTTLDKGLTSPSSYGPAVYDLTVFDDGAGSALFAGGHFNTAGGVSANAIAKWDGWNWSAVGTSARNLATFLVVEDENGPALYAGGDFTIANGIRQGVAKWDGSTWTAVGADIGYVWALALYDDGTGPALHAGGKRQVTKWDGTSWSAIPPYSGFAEVFSLAAFDDGTGPLLYAGAATIHIPEESFIHQGIAKWDGSSWSELGSGIVHPLRAQTVFDDGNGPALYASGAFFQSSNGDHTSRVSRWDGSSWSTVGGPVYGAWKNDVNALHGFDDGSGPALYAGGSFSMAGGVSANNVAKWDGLFWSPLGGGIDGEVRALTSFDDGNGPSLYAAGCSYSGTGPCHFVRKWDGTSWSEIGKGDGSVETLIVFDDGARSALYAGGRFRLMNGVLVSRIAKWDGASWSAPGGPLYGSGVDGGIGMDVRISAFAVFDDGTGQALYAAGQFSYAGQERANSIARWDGWSWSALGDGIDGEVAALTVFDDGCGPALVAGGRFTVAGEVRANQIAQWDGSSWSAFGSGVSSDYPGVLSLAVFDDGSGPALCVGGGFLLAGGRASAHFARWRDLCPHCDSDVDADVDAADFRALLDCLDGPGILPRPPGCTNASLDAGHDIDLGDFAIMQNQFTGGGN